MRAIAAVGVCFVLFAASVSARAAEAEKWVAEGGCPVIEHVPLAQVLRGTPAVITAKIECPGGQLTEVLLQIRLIDGGQSTSQIKMTGKGDGMYQATVPVSLVRGIARFWYYIDTKGRTASGEESILQTGWKPVNIIDHGSLESGGRKAGWYWLAGGAALVGGAIAIENNNDSGGGGSESPPPPNPSGGGPTSSTGSTPPPCTLSGAEAAALSGNTSPCFGGPDLDIAVCGTCPGAVVRVIASWGAVRQRTFQNEIPCDPSQVPVIKLPKPDFPSGPESETISVLVNGVLIQQFRWPSETEYFDCL